MRGETRLFVGNLPSDIREREVDDLFYKFGRIIDIAVRTPRDKPGYCFIEFEDDRDADDAQYERDGYEFAGRRIRVEFASRDRGRGDRDRGDRRGGRGGDRDRDRGGRNGGDRDRAPRASKPPKTEYRLKVEGLPEGSSWQDLKDFARNLGGGDVTFTKVMGGVGEVEYSNLADMEAALEGLDGKEFTSKTGDRAEVKVISLYDPSAAETTGNAPDPAPSADDGGAAEGAEEDKKRGDEDAEAEAEEAPVEASED